MPAKNKTESGGFSAEERAAMQQRAAELRAEGKSGAKKADSLQAALDSKKTVQANFVKPLPVYIVYFSSAALLDGRIVNYRDLYGRDSRAMAALQMRDGGASLATPKTEVAGKPKPKPKPGDQVATR